MYMYMRFATYLLSPRLLKTSPYGVANDSWTAALRKPYGAIHTHEIGYFVRCNLLCCCFVCQCCCIAVAIAVVVATTAATNGNRMKMPYGVACGTKGVWLTDLTADFGPKK